MMSRMKPTVMLIPKTIEASSSAGARRRALFREAPNAGVSPRATAAMFAISMP